MDENNNQSETNTDKPWLSRIWNRIRWTIIILGLIILLAAISGRFLFTPQQTVDSCDPTLWDHIWNSSRLEIINNCTSVTGTIVSSLESNDGDQHIQLLPDQQYTKLLNKNNIELQLGSLVIEPICSHDISVIDNTITYVLDDEGSEELAKEACKGFVSDVYIPKVGEHVRITGSYVLDKAHDWMEIHPVSKIEVIK